VETKIGVKCLGFHLKLYEWLGIFCTEPSYFRLPAVPVSYPGCFSWLFGKAKLIRKV